jgi:hypothetical protein
MSDSMCDFFVVYLDSIAALQNNFIYTFIPMLLSIVWDMICTKCQELTELPRSGGWMSLYGEIVC